MIPPPLLPPVGAVIVSPASSVLRPKSNEFVAVIVPAPVVVMPQNAAHDGVEAPLDKLIVAAPVVKLLLLIRVCEDELPVTENPAEPVIVVVDDAGNVT